MILRPFIDSADFLSLSGDLKWQGNVLQADYTLKGSLQKICNLEPCSKARARVQGLWKTTCFEWFLRPILKNTNLASADLPYWEANFSTAGDWNLFYLEGYRKNLMVEPQISSVLIQSSGSELEWHLITQVDFSALNFSTRFPVGTQFQAHLSAVLETVDQKKSYWSLKHSQKQPDFHHPDHFVLKI